MPVEIIAEIGLNHNGGLDEAKSLIDAAKSVGADTAKFQASHPAEEISGKYEADFLAMVGKLIPSFDTLAKIKEHCEQTGIEFLCTPADIRSMDELIAMGVKRLKIGSDNLTNAVLLNRATAVGLPLIVSTGMATLSEIGAAFGYLPWDGTVTLMHCTSAYPCPASDANLLAIERMRVLFPCGIGWSDHTTSMTLPAVAVGLGACKIEKHLTMSMWSEGPDHRASLEPMAFGIMVNNIREAEAALGDGIKRLMPSEEANAKLMRKSLMASRIIRKGKTFTADNLTAKRPGWGRSAMDYYAVLGTVAAKEYDTDEMVD